MSRATTFCRSWHKVRPDSIDHHVDMTYGTIRFIEKDAETFLPWAKQPSVCIVCNLNVVHHRRRPGKGGRRFSADHRPGDRVRRPLYLTYHRWATRKQVETCYPQFVDFLRLKKKYDPRERFQSDWYRHYQTMFAGRL